MRANRHTRHSRARVRRRERHRLGDRRARQSEVRHQHDRHRQVQHERPRVHDQVPARAPHHDQDEPRRPDRDVHHLADQQDAERGASSGRRPPEHVQHGPGRDGEHDQDRDRPGHRPARQRLVQLVQPVTLSARVQIGDERAEHVVHGGQEQHQRLRHAHRGRVHAEVRGAVHVRARARSSPSRTAAGTAARPARAAPVADQPAGLAGLGGQLREARRLAAATGTTPQPWRATHDPAYASTVGRDRLVRPPRTPASGRSTRPAGPSSRRTACAA